MLPYKKWGNTESSAIANIVIAHFSLYRYGIALKTDAKVTLKKRASFYQRPMRSEYEGVDILKEITFSIGRTGVKDRSIAYTVPTDYLFLASLCLGMLIFVLQFYFDLKFSVMPLGLLGCITFYFWGREYIKKKTKKIILEALNK